MKSLTLRLAAIFSPIIALADWSGFPLLSTNNSAWWTELNSASQPISQLWDHACEVYDVGAPLVEPISGYAFAGHSQHVVVAYNKVYVTNFSQVFGGTTQYYTMTNTIQLYSNLNVRLDITATNWGAPYTNTRSLGPYPYTWGDTSGVAGVLGLYDTFSYIDQIYLQGICPDRPGASTRFVAGWLKEPSGDFDDYLSRTHVYSNHPSRFTTNHPHALPSSNIAGILMGAGLTNTVLPYSIVTNDWNAVTAGTWGYFNISNRIGPVVLAEMSYLPNLKADGFTDPQFNNDELAFTLGHSVRSGLTVSGRWTTNSSYGSFRYAPSGGFIAESNTIMYAYSLDGGGTGTWRTADGAIMPDAYVEVKTNDPGTWCGTPEWDNLYEGERVFDFENNYIYFDIPALRPVLYYLPSDSNNTTAISVYLYGREVFADSNFMVSGLGSLWSNTYTTVVGTNGLAITNRVALISSFGIQTESNWRDTVSVRWPSSPSYFLPGTYAYAPTDYTGWWQTHWIDQRQIIQKSFDVVSQTIATTNIAYTNCIQYTWSGYGWTDAAANKTTNDAGSAYPAAWCNTCDDGGTVVPVVAADQAECDDLTVLSMELCPGTNGSFDYGNFGGGNCEINTTNSTSACVTNLGWAYSSPVSGTLHFYAEIFKPHASGSISATVSFYDTADDSLITSMNLYVSGDYLDSEFNEVSFHDGYPIRVVVSWSHDRSCIDDDTAHFAACAWATDMSCGEPVAYVEAVRRSASIKMGPYLPAIRTNAFLRLDSKKTLYLKAGVPDLTGLLASPPFANEGLPPNWDSSIGIDQTRSVYEETSAGYPAKFEDLQLDTIPFSGSTHSKGWQVEGGFWTVDFDVVDGFEYK